MNLLFGIETDAYLNNKEHMWLNNILIIPNK